MIIKRIKIILCLMIHMYTSAYAVGLRLTMLQIYLYQYWTVAETQKKGRSAPRPCVDIIIIDTHVLSIY